jgi:CysZ protein
MTQITCAIALSISQFSDRRFQRVVLKSIILAIVALWALAAGGGSVLGWLFGGDLTLPWIGTITFSGSLIGWGAFWIILGLSVFLMVPVASAMSAFFVDDVARAVEERHYPNTQAQYRSKLSEEVRESLGFLGTMLVANLIALIFYAFFAVFAPIIFWSLNGYLIGREYFYMAAKRHLGRDNALSVFRDHRFRVWMCGVILVLPMSVPLLNLVVPVLAAASFTHLFQGWMADRNGQRNLNHPR